MSDVRVRPHDNERIGVLLCGAEHILPANEWQDIISKIEHQLEQIKQFKWKKEVSERICKIFDEWTSEQGDEFAEAIFDPFYGEECSPKEAIEEELSNWTD